MCNPQKWNFSDRQKTFVEHCNIGKDNHNSVVKNR